MKNNHPKTLLDTSIKGHRYILATFWNHPFQKSIQKGLSKRGATLISKNDVVDEIHSMKNLDQYSKKEKFNGILIPSSENPKDNEWLASILKCPIYTELDFAQQILNTPLIAITGTNGKTSTTEMLTQGLKNLGLKVKDFLNFERSLLELTKNDLDFAILECWSSQLEFCHSFAPKIAVLLNLDPDHIDQHGSFNNYKLSKSKIFLNQKKDDILIYNFEDLNVLNLLHQFSKKGGLPIGFGRKKPSKEITNALYLHENEIYWRKEGKDQKIMPLPSWPNWGPHFLSNRLATLAVVQSQNWDLQAFSQHISSYKIRSYRQEILNPKNKIQFVNDALSTTPHAAQAALERFLKKPPLVWITGGMDKKITFSPFCNWLTNQPSFKIIILGKQLQFEKELKKFDIPFQSESNLPNAVKKAKSLISPKGTILFSPIGSPEDLFSDVHDRGAQFNKAVQNL